MKPTLKQEIGMSQDGIEYVDSLEVKNNKNESFVINPEFMYFLDEIYAKHNLNRKSETFDLVEAIKIEQQRIKKQSQKVWAFVFLGIVFVAAYLLNN